MKRMVTMQDLSCLGKCSLTVILPVISAMGIECAVLPTAVLSTHTAFPGPAVMDLSPMAGRTMDHWSTLDPGFSGILTGYLANPQQVELAKDLIRRFGHDAIVVSDPAMADHGRLYSGLSQEMIPAMLSLCREADLILPNLTEGALMTGMAYREESDPGHCREIAAELLKAGVKSVLLTGAEEAPGRVGFYWTDGHEEFSHSVEKEPRSCHGTGDLFAAVTMGGMMRGMTPGLAGLLAAEFIRRSIAATGVDSRYGVAFEQELAWLIGNL